jgi:two-component system OmpR family sensor kinase
VTDPPRRGRGLRARLRALPLRWRLLGVALGLILVALVLTTVSTGALLRGYLLGQAEKELEVYGASVTSLQISQIEQGKSLLPTGFTLRVQPVGSDDQFTIGEAVTTTHRADIPILRPDDPLVTEGRTFLINSIGEEGVQWMALALPSGDRTATFVIALPLGELEATVGQFLGYASAIGVIVLVASAVLGHFLVRRAFRPLTRIEDTAAAIAAGDLTRRVDEPSSADEIASLSSSLNVMLGRIERSFALREANEEKMRRFIADASHELRTPLAAVSGYAELYRQGALPTSDSVAGAMGRIEGESQRMRVLVEDLLTLARLDGERPLQLQTVDLAVLAAEAAQDARTIEPDRGITVTGLGGPIGPTVVVADERKLRQVVTNLVTNARLHTPADSPVEVLVGPSAPGTASVHVRDHGRGIPEQDRGRVFERFYRADTSRSRSRGGGSGLGLAIVAAIVAAHGGNVRVVETPGGGATFVMDLPTRGPTPTGNT